MNRNSAGTIAPHSPRGGGKKSTENNAPMVEIFGGLFALMLVLFVIVNLLSEAAVRERIDNTNEEGLYRINWGDSGSGYVVLTFPANVRIIENNMVVDKDNICAANSPFVEYVHHIYNQKKKQIVFAILENSVPVMRRARDCIAQRLPGRSLTIGWIIATRELLKSVPLNDIPPYIEKVITQ